ncbi:MAG: Rrf2 family transcriptional regulator [Armatimonadetes bacterium]|nr:Rrf2 family transcriptional regulator [Armatimonadota bacterium]
MMWIAGQPPGRPIQAEEIATGASIPCKFARNIFSQLVNSGLLRPHRGAVRGYSLARSASEITLLEIIEAYEGPFVKPWCFLNHDRVCNAESPCQLHHLWSGMRDSVCHILASRTLEGLAGSEGIKEAGHQGNKNSLSHPHREQP